MAIYEDLQWLEDELLEEETDEEEFDEEDSEEEEDCQPLIRRRSRRSRAAVYADERQLGEDDAVFVEKKKKRKVKGLRKLKFLALLELVGILAVLWWWIKWLY